MNTHFKKYSKHLPHYLPLIGIFTAGFLAFQMFSYDQGFQVGVAVSVCIAHVVWGVVHHTIHRDLSFEIVLEYVAIAALGLAVILTLIFRS